MTQRRFYRRLGEHVADARYACAVERPDSTGRVLRLIVRLALALIGVMLGAHVVLSILGGPFDAPI